MVLQTKRILLRFGLLLFVFPLLISGQTDPDAIKVETSLVWIPVSIKAKNGAGIADLTKDRFTVFEDGVEQQIAHFETPGTPITVALVIDMSDSAKMSLAEMRLAAIAFIDKLKPKDKALIVAFDKNIHRVIGATDDREMLRLGLFGIKSGGGTALYDTVDHVVTSSFDGVNGRKAVILLTDGIDTASMKTTLERSADLVAAGNVAFFPIQYQPEDTMRKRLSSENSHIGSTIYTTPSGEPIASAHQRGTRYLRLLADSSGGRFQLADSTKNLEAAFIQIAAELRQQYYLGYYPERSAQKNEKRKLKVTVNVPDARIDARDSYIAKP
jgi:VWFA-related protein